MLNAMKKIIQGNMTVTEESSLDWVVRKSLFEEVTFGLRPQRQEPALQRARSGCRAQPIRSARFRFKRHPESQGGCNLLSKKEQMK